jgi:ribosome maturation factor RimP
LEVLFTPVVSAMGYELVGVEYQLRGRQGLLRVYIDKPSGITLDDCERVSHQVSGLLDVEDPIAGHYTLEVSSPGLDRPLFKAEDFERFAGSTVRLRLDPSLAGRRNMTGSLDGLEGDAAVIVEDGVRHTIPLRQIKQARLVPQF